MHAVCDKESKLLAHALGKLPLAAWLEGLAGNMQKSGGKRCGPALGRVLIERLRNDDGDGETGTILSSRFMENVSGQIKDHYFLYLFLNLHTSFRIQLQKKIGVI